MLKNILCMLLFAIILGQFIIFKSNMKKYQILIIVLCFTTLCFGQQRELRHYYYWVNQAELAICDSNYQHASDCYDKAFSQHRPIGGDASHAFYVNYFIHDINRAVECFHYEAQMGSEPEWYVSDTLKNIELWRRIRLVNDTTKRLVIPQLEEAVTEIRNSDQKVRQHFSLDDTVQGRIIYETDSLNLLKIRNLYNTYPEISLYTTGMGPELNALYIHFFRDFLLLPKEILLEEVYKGFAHASLFAKLEDICEGTLVGAQGVYGTSTNYFFKVDTIGFIIIPENIEKINKARRKIFLSETWDDYAKKVRFSYLKKTNITITSLSDIYLTEEEVARWKESIDKGEVKGYYFIIPKVLRW